MGRFYALWLAAVAFIALSAAGVQSFIEARRWTFTAQTRMNSLMMTLEDSLIANFKQRRFAKIERTIQKLRSTQDLEGLAICPRGPVKRLPVGFPLGSGLEKFCADDHVICAKDGATESWSSLTENLPLKYFVHTIESTEPPLVLVTTLDISYMRRHWIDAFVRTFLLTFLGGITVLILITTQLRGWVKQNVSDLHKSLNALIAGKYLGPSSLPSSLKHLSKDLSKIAAKIQPLHSLDRLGALKRRMGGRNLTVIANREPYIHQRSGNSIEVIRPASGLVTALEPILRHCGGLWIGHGSGSADKEAVDALNEVAVPPNNPTYKLRRVWLTSEEESGYYYGFSNEGFWPLCHLAHTRPTFRLSDWNHYQAVNQKFSDAVPEQSLDRRGLILVQDYHFAMAPGYLRESLERRRSTDRAKIGLFWHIPWPNAETFGICPWGPELLHGMLGADAIGFHTQYHCNNFLETCNRYLEARIDYERFSVTMGNHETLIRAFPIGIDTSPVTHLSDSEVVELKKKYGIHARHVAVGVDRLDYTKGLVERVDGIERFLEKYPQYIGNFSFVQMGSPSRTSIPAYQELATKLEAAVARVNTRFGRYDGKEPYRPIILLATHHDWDEIQKFYQVGQVCMVTSLHDGMNLVAKEYVWCQHPSRGSLILSRFTGASRELTEAFIVNPYSTEEIADAIAQALALSREEREVRMQSMRKKVESHNAFNWATDLLQALITKTEDAQTPPTSRGRRGKSKLVNAPSAKSASAILGASARGIRASFFH
jgi:trehalose-6-phosphate synthase